MQQFEDEKTEFIAHGYYTISNLGGYEIEINASGDGARLKYYDTVRDWQEIQYNNDGDPFVIDAERSNDEILLSNFLRY